MGRRVAEHVVRTKFYRPPVVLRVDLHGVSSFGPGDERTLIRWEWIQEIDVQEGVVVRAPSATLTLPPGAFGLDPVTLARRLEEARSLTQRADVIEVLAGES